MTNGEKFKQIFPNYQIDMGELYVYVWLPNHDAVDIPHEWWDAEYREPITKNDLVVIHTEGLDEGIRCAMCTNSMANDLGCDGGCVVNKSMYKKVMDVIESHIAEVPSVSIKPKGHWTEEFNDLEGEVRFTCSSCGKYQLFGTDFCYHCGSDNREVDK